MKRLSLTIMLACGMLTMAAQEDIKVNYQGAKPTISDFITAFLAPVYGEDGECDESTNAVRNAWERHQKGIKQPEGNTFTLDVKNGYAVYEIKYDNNLLRWEMCFWNEADGKHKLFAYNVACFQNGKYSPGQYDGLTFLRYDNATKKMNFYQPQGFDAVYEQADGAWIYFELPRTGKDLKVTWSWDDKNQTKQKIMKWNGSRFTF